MIKSQFNFGKQIWQHKMQLILEIAWVSFFWIGLSLLVGISGLWGISLGVLNTFALLRERYIWGKRYQSIDWW